MQANSKGQRSSNKDDIPMQILKSLADLMLNVRGIPLPPERPRWISQTKVQIPPLFPSPPRPHRRLGQFLRGYGKKKKHEDPTKKYKLGQAMPILFKLLRFYGFDFAEKQPATKTAACRRKFFRFLSYSVDIVCILPYIIYCMLVVDPYYSSRGSTIYFYLLKINLFTFGLSRLILRNHTDKFNDIRERLCNLEVDLRTLNKGRLYSRRLVVFIVLAVSISLMVLIIYLITTFAFCRFYKEAALNRHCTSKVWLYFSFYCAITSLFTAICFFSFACTAFAFICCVTLRHNLKMATQSIKNAQSTRNAAERFVQFVSIHAETQVLIDLIDTVFSKIPFMVILVQISSVSMVLRIPSCTYGIIDEKIMAFCSCISNIAMYCIAVLWITSASKLNQEFYRSIRILSFILVNHDRFLGPVWMKQLVINYLIYVEFLKIKPVGITLGGYTFAEALENARFFQYTTDLLTTF